MDRIKSIVGQKIVIYNKEGKLLILKRSMMSDWGGGRDLPGGGILMGEDAIPSLEREVLEEIGLKNIKGIHVVHTKAKSYAEGTHSYLVGYMGIMQDHQDVIISHEHDEYLWIDPKDIESYNLPDHRLDTVMKSMK